MTRAEILLAMDGHHPTVGKWVSIGLNLFILISAICITLQTVETLPDWLRAAIQLFEIAILVVFTIEYLTRLTCAPKPLRYAFSFWGIVDLLSCLPILAVINTQWAALRSLRVVRLMRLLKLMRSSRALDKLHQVLETTKADLFVFAMLASLVLYIAAVGIYIFEHEAQPEAFGSIPASFWWAVVSFTTVGYGDAYPITAEGRIFTAAILFVGLGVIAVPAAVITSALIDQTRQERQRKERYEASQPKSHHHHLRPRHGRRNNGNGR